MHLYTATGVPLALLALNAVIDGRYGDAYWWLMVSAIVDSTDGPLARRLDVKHNIPEVDGALMDNIIDYVTWTFVPLVLIGHAGWLPDPAWPWLTLAGAGSLYAFSHRDAKQADDGFFRGFPSYWGLVAFYVDVGVRQLGPWAVAGVLALLGLLSVLPVRFVYPNRAPRFRGVFVLGGLINAALFLFMLGTYPDVPLHLVAACSVYPAFYILGSFWLDLSARRRARGA